MRSRYKERASGVVREMRSVAHRAATSLASISKACGAGAASAAWLPAEEARRHLAGRWRAVEERRRRE